MRSGHAHDMVDACCVSLLTQLMSCYHFQILQVTPAQAPTSIHYNPIKSAQDLADAATDTWKKCSVVSIVLPCIDRDP